MPRIQHEALTWKRVQTAWSDCRACSLCEIRKKVVLLRGQIPCDVLFIGDAPGLSEDILGKPFVGPAGKLLERMIAEARNQVTGFAASSDRVAFTNLIGCISLSVDKGRLVEPDSKSIIACHDRLVETIQLCRPKLIVAVGKLAAKRLSLFNLVEHSVVEIIHPAAILQADVSQQNLLFQRTVITLIDAFESL